MKKFLKKMVAISTLTTAGVHVANCIIENSATEKNILTTRNGHYYHWKYGDIFYTKEGNGSPVLFIHNLTPDSSAYEWSKIKHLFTKEYTVYTLDLIGCGRSDKPFMTYTNYLYVKLLHDFTKEIIGQKTSIISSGTSGTFSIMSSLMNEEDFEKIILINPPAIDENRSIHQKISPVSKLIMKCPVYGTCLYNILMRKTYIQYQCCNNYCAKRYSGKPNIMDAYYESAHLKQSKGRYLFASIYGQYTNVDISKALTSLQNPLLIIESKSKQEEDTVIPQYQELNKTAKGTRMEESLCLPHMEVPKKTFHTIHSFLQN
ncbi:MAG: alpha/beta hydrolase [Lachnospiraceae bacterium]